jgi:hypothetical protein
MGWMGRHGDLRIDLRASPFFGSLGSSSETVLAANGQSISVFLSRSCGQRTQSLSSLYSVKPLSPQFISDGT